MSKEDLIKTNIQIRNKKSYSLNLEKTLKEFLYQALQARGLEAKTEVTPQTVLFETGLDSLGFAILVSRLEQELNYDPFTLMSQPIYPKTFGEFVDIYKKFYPLKG